MNEKQQVDLTGVNESRSPCEWLRARAFEACLLHFSNVFMKGEKAYAIPPGSVDTDEHMRQFAGFIFWTAWAASSNRPHDTISDLHCECLPDSQASSVKQDIRNLVAALNPRNDLGNVLGLGCQSVLFDWQCDGFKLRRIMPGM